VGAVLPPGLPAGADVVKMIGKSENQGEGMGWFTDLLGGIPVNVVLRERQALLVDRVQALTKEKVDLEQKLGEALAELAEAKGKLDAQIEAATKEMVEESGALFKRKPGGGYHEVVYCPKCGFSVAAVGFFLTDYTCSCGWRADFTKDQLADVMARLPKND
jgi:hypothetical protein